MTSNGRRCLEIIAELERDVPDNDGYFMADSITDRYLKKYDDLKDRTKPIMTVSSYLTHLKRQGYVKRLASSDKLFAWWGLTKQGRKALAA